ncbi:MAG: hypothetical protein PGN15_11925 [Aeromicrobium erythreum]
MRSRPVMPVTRRRSRSAGALVPPLALTAVLLAGCGGSISPGAAATVDGTTITMAQADRTADVLCEVSLFSAAQSGGGSTIDNADVRRQAVSELVSGVVAREVAAREGIRVPRSAYVFTGEQRAQVEQALPDVDVDEAVRVLEAGQRTYAIAEKLGEAATGQRADDTNAQQLQQAGRSVLADALRKADVSIDPRFGLGDDGQQMAATGSLSVPAAADTRDRPLIAPATQRCS